MVQSEIERIEKEVDSQKLLQKDTFLAETLINKMTELRWPGIDVETKIKKMFGNGFVQNIMNQQTLKNIRENCVACPKCGEPIEKNGGCNHMICRCGHHFQYRGQGVEIKDIHSYQKKFSKGSQKINELSHL